MKIKLLNAATATNSPPSGATAGFPLRKGDGQILSNGFGEDVNEAVFALVSTAGSATMTCTIRLWGYAADSAAWHPMGPQPTGGTDASRGEVNNATAIGEIASDVLSYSEVVRGFKHFDRVYAEIVAIGGTNTAVSAWLISRGG